MIEPASETEFAAYLRWRDSPDSLIIDANIAHVEKYGACGCIGNFWLPRKNGVSDLFALDDCQACGANYYYDGDGRPHNLLFENYGQIEESVGDILREAYLLDPENYIVICRCCLKNAGIIVP